MDCDRHPCVDHGLNIYSRDDQHLAADFRRVVKLTPNIALCKHIETYKFSLLIIVKHSQITININSNI